MSTELNGWRVLVTRAEDQADTLSQALRDLGAEVIGVPLLSVEPMVAPDLIRAELEYAASRSGHVAITSRNAARFCLDACPWVGVWMGVKVWCIGASTQAALPAVTWTQPLPDRPSAVALADLMLASGLSQGDLVWAPAAEAADDRLVSQLESAGVEVRVTVVYRAVLPADAPRLVKQALGSRIDAITLTSGSAARHLVLALGGAELPKQLVVACIGPSTAEAATQAGLRVDVVAQNAGANALADALRSHASDRGR